MASSVARARCSALLTEATLVSSSSAASEAFHLRTSQRISAARCFAGRCCRAAMNASRIDSRVSATAAGSFSDGRTSASGIGSSQVTSGRISPIGPCRVARRAEVHRARALLAAVERVDADVRGDPVQPRAQAVALEAVEGAPGAQHRVLDGVLGLERRAEHPVAIGGQLAPVLLELTEVGGGSRGFHGHHATPPTRRLKGGGRPAAHATRRRPPCRAARPRRRPESHRSSPTPRSPRPRSRCRSRRRGSSP